MNKTKTLLVVLFALFALIIFAFSFYFASFRPVNKDNTVVTFVIESGSSTEDILKDLQRTGLIRSVPAGMIYIKINNISLKAGVYELASNMTMETILKKIATGDIDSTIRITFIEGKRLTSFVKTISEKFKFNEDEIISELKDEAYIKELIEEYWFLTDEILNKDIYYPLEGYLFPDTYEFEKNATIKNIIEKMLKNTERKLNTYKDKIEISSYSVLELLTIASIIELEGRKEEDRKTISGVIYNRLNTKMSLGMCATTYYAVGKEMTDVLTLADLATVNPYNTRLTSLIGLPPGAIANSSLQSIDAAINPPTTEYLYFYSDPSGKLYFQKTYEEHQQIIKEVG